MAARLSILAVLLLMFVAAAWQIQNESRGELEPGFVSLFDGRSLEGWLTVGGESTFHVDSREIVGTHGPGENTFLRTDKTYSDFILKLQFRWDEPGNSGIMLRGQQRDGDGRVYGYQSELDDGERAWSGGIYDEARRGWLQTLEGRDEARAAIRLDDWNDIRIEARGTSIKTFINEVPVADLVDGMDAEGFIALQVHSGNRGIMRWRNIRIQELPPVTALGVALDRLEEWQLRAVDDIQWQDGALSLRGEEGEASSRRQFGDAQFSFDLALCDQPQRLRVRSRPHDQQFAELEISRQRAQARVGTDGAVEEFEPVDLTGEDSASISLLAQGDAVVITVDEQEVLRWDEPGLPDRGRFSLAPGGCAEGLQLQNFAWLDLNGGSREPKFYESLDTEPAPVLTPEQALADFVVPDDFVVELVAAEPLVGDPVAMDWDEHGRLYVVEMRGFMPDAYGTGQEEPVGRIVRLTDTDGDGAMDDSEVFLDKLVNPRAVAVTNDGVLVAEPPALWLCEMPNKDSVCDSKRNLGDYGTAPEGTSIEHLENGLMFGLDNWLVSAKSDRELRIVDGELQQRGTNFRGQWGISKDNYGRIFSNNNSNFISADFFAAEDLLQSGVPLEGGGLSYVLTAPEEVFSIRVNPGVNRAYLDDTLREDGRLRNATAVSGLAVYRGDQFPIEYRNDVFVPEPGANVVARFTLSEQDLALSAEHQLYPDERWGQREFMGSTDERFRPVDAHIGPDGALYIIDMYRGIIQEQHFLTEELREQIFQRELETPIGYGRIWRVRHREGRAGQVASSLGDASSMELVLALFDPNGWVRDTAQRLLLARPDEARAELAKVVSAESTYAAIHALWTLHGRGQLDRELLLAGIAKGDARRTQQALRAGRGLLQAEDLLAVGTDEVMLAMQVAFSLGDYSDSTQVRARLRELLLSHPESELVSQAVIRASVGHELPMLEEMMADTEFAEGASSAKLFSQLTASAYRSLRGDLSSTEEAPSELPEILALAASRAGEQEWQQIAMLQGLNRVSTSSGFQPARLPQAPPIFTDTEIDGDSPLWAARLQGRRAYTWPGDELAAGVTPLSPDQLALMQQGEAFYAGCATCHGRDGKGVAGLAPALADASWVTGPPEWLGRIILQGMTGPVEVNGEVFDGVMPPHGQQPQLDDATLAGLMTYLRRSWGHTADPVTVSQVAAIREASGGRSAPWTVAELEQVPYDRGFARFAGKYKVSFITMSVYEQDGDLYIEVPMYGGGKMTPESDTVFSGSAGSETVRVEFVVEEDGSVPKFIMHRQGQKFPVSRVEG